MFTVGEHVTLILADIELKGTDDNTDALLVVEGTLHLNAGAKIFGNTNLSDVLDTENQGGGVRVAAGGLLEIDGGSIAGNRAAIGGGVGNLGTLILEEPLI